jgi:hypothetical protein
MGHGFNSELLIYQRVYYFMDEFPMKTMIYVEFSNSTCDYKRIIFDWLLEKITSGTGNI